MVRRVHIQVVFMLMMATSSNARAAMTADEDLRAGIREGDVTKIAAAFKAGADVNKADPGGVTPLQEALSKQQWSVVDILLDRKANVKVRDDRGNTPLHTAAEAGNATLARKLLLNGAIVNATNLDEMSPLFLASNRDVAIVLIRHGALLNAKSRDGDTSLHHHAAQNHTDIVGLLIVEGADINAQNRNGETPIFRAQKDMAQLLVKLGANARARDRFGNTLLHFTRGNDFSYLISLGLDPKARNLRGETPLHIAAQDGSQDTAIVLYVHGAAIDARDKYGRTPLFEVSEWSLTGDPARSMAAWLVGKGADVMARDACGATPLHWAMLDDATPTAQFYLSRGAQIEAKDINGYTPADWTALGVTDSMSKFLKANGVDIMAATVNAATMLMACPLIDAAALGLKETVRRRILEKEDVNAFSDIGYTPLLRATLRNHADVVRLLLYFGADMNTSYNFMGPPPYIAAMYGRMELLNIFFDYGLDVNRPFRRGGTLLHAACEYAPYGLDAIEALLARGADVNSRDDFNMTPLTKAASAFNNTNRKQVVQLLRKHGANYTLEDAALMNDATTMRTLIRQDPDALKAGSPYLTRTLYAMTVNNSTSTMKLLLDQDIDPNIDIGGATCLHMAAACDRPEIAEILIDAGADVNAYSSMLGTTPLHEAAGADFLYNRPVEREYDEIKGSTAVVKLLLSRGAKSRLPSIDGFTPEEIAVRKKHFEVAELIREYAEARVESATKEAH